MNELGELRILVVCLGNICRSPMAHGVLLRRLEHAGLGDRVHVDSAGTGDYHIGKGPDPRARMATGGRGYDISQLRARQVEPVDFHLYDLILAADRENLADLMAIAPGPEERAKVRLLLSYGRSGAKEVPDPYEGGEADFDLALDLIEDAVDGLVGAIERDEWARDASA
ncbi:MAG TPA: low molecular weight protein-tyrosine-phosphatase [Gammaproteobacteria bacterium]|nr:low molecular weight protein-tyrosine-phosphatase [Gammaproteobacteria bacterium]